ncbi:hypothetical protein OIC43_07255 [Streptomyces sp. NBC_00825]|uniref:hypothetical protein n=1 Tax=unclassified Streptomyces TaxID=2593676 RepID=UPI002ED10D84|nr:hypothetical protein OG832_36450 [Streptomyces sp. NBC_00826]WTH95470.1 hypothetical protein OIC43_07255 [Streptomyces sp. NBC_00825]WTI04199.1 hypothetical protein OHA23_07260 [Streptomyces sp. NBC_00822]
MGYGRAGWVRVPVGDDAARWATRGKCLRVLLVVHNVTAATRLLDVLPLFDDDLRVQLLVTCTGSSAFASGTAELLADTGVPVLPWEQAVETAVDLVVSASFGGQLDAFSGKLAVLSHGVGYTKRLATPDTGHRTPDTGSGAGAPAPVFGLAPPWLLSDRGTPVADALVLSHPEQFERLRGACPEAVPTAVLAGDPCFDRILAARTRRRRFRRALGVRPGQRLVLLNSTWNSESLFGDGTEVPGDGWCGGDVVAALLDRVADEFPVDEYRFAAVLHPNIWHGHGPGQIRAWLDRARRGGLALIDPLTEWRQALLAADAVIGDHGSVTYYAAALGTPVLLGAVPLHALDPDAPISAFMREAPRLDPDASLSAQIGELIRCHRPLPGPAEFTTSVPGESAARLRTLFYSMMGAPEPDRPATLEPLPLPGYGAGTVTVPLQVLTRVLGTGEIAVSRWAGARPGTGPDPVGELHVAVHEDTREVDRLELADVIFREGEPDDPRFGSPSIWTAEVLRRHPGCSLAAYVTGPSECVVRVRGEEPLRMVAVPDVDAEDVAGTDPAAYASALYAWLAAEGREAVTAHARALTEELVLRTGDRLHRVRVVPLTPSGSAG